MEHINLITTAQHGILEQPVLCIENGADLKMNVMDINTQLITAAEQGDLKTVQCCLDNGADPKLWDSHALTRAVTNNHIDVVKILIPISNLNTFNAVALRTAIDLQHHDIVDLLWDQVNHACILSQSTGSPTPFYVACQNGLFDRALSVLHHPMHNTVVQECLDALNKNTTDLQELQIWKDLIQRSTPDQILSRVESAIPSELPRVEILQNMWHTLRTHPNATMLCRQFVKEICGNQYTTHHIASLYPAFKAIYPTLEPNVKIQVLSHTLQYNMLLAQEMIEHCQAHKVQLLQPEMMLSALRGDMSLLNYCLKVWDSQRWIISGAYAAHQYDHILSSHCVDAPHKVLRVLEEHPHFHTPKVLLALLEKCSDEITPIIQTWMESEEAAIFNIAEPTIWEYWQDYKNRQQQATIEEHLKQTILTHQRKM